MLRGGILAYLSFPPLEVHRGVCLMLSEAEPFVEHAFIIYTKSTCTGILVWRPFRCFDGERAAHNSIKLMIEIKTKVI